jgi:hypothetical protein
MVRADGQGEGMNSHPNFPDGCLVTLDDSGTYMVRSSDYVLGFAKVSPFDRASQILSLDDLQTVKTYRLENI